MVVTPAKPEYVTVFMKPPTKDSVAAQCVQQRLACSVGVSPTGVEVRNPLAWVVSVEENEAEKAD